MASRLVFAIFVIIGAMVPISALAKEIIVGDGVGWRLGFDYQAWAKTKNFRVGDKLVFQYPVGYHNVFRVNGTVFQSCTIPPANEALTTGNDTIVLATPGNKWYICGVGKHCDEGMRLAITVQPACAKAPSPGPAPVSASSKEIIVGDDAGWRLGYDYQSWAQTKDFRVGDKLIFKYPVEAHNVLRVNGTGFQSCIKPPANEALTTGNDTILLATPGSKRYICGVGKHCENGMRLAITVKPAYGVGEAPIPSIAPPPSPSSA